MWSEEARKGIGRKVAIWIIFNILILLCTPVLHYIYLDQLLDYEYATGVRTSTSGDNIIIPVFGGFIFLVMILFVVNVLAAIYLHRCTYRAKRR